MSDDLVRQSIAELQDLVRCRCHEAYTSRGLHDPNCDCDSAEAVRIVADRIKELEAKLATCKKYRDAYAECDRIGTQSVRELEAKLAKAVDALELIAQPKVGPDFDWSHDEVNRWRDRWYRKYQNIARSTLAELTGGKDE